MIDKPSNGNPLSILLVEDNAAHAELVKRNFQNHRVANIMHHVSDGETALDYLFRRGTYCDLKPEHQTNLVLLDLRLPKIDGLEVLRQIKTSEQLSRLPVIVLTTSEAEKDVARAYEYRANSYIVKPMDYQKFTHLMDDLGFYWLAWNHNPWI
ncbi:MAG: response regulator [Candidatus Thiodiazotropha endolucinida]